MCKLAENASRDVNVAFANELSMICDRHGIAVWDLIALANHHPRVKILQPGCGVGGHCVAVDPWFIVAAAPEQSRLIRTAREVNDAKTNWVHDQIAHGVAALVADGREESSVVVAVLGLTYKPNVADLRESPALRVARRLSSHTTARLLAVDPHVETLPALLDRVELACLEPAIQQADVVALLVGHREFHDMPRQLLAGKHVVDVTGILTASEP
jgi:UDP-N-acetyl-D-mannosaminuronic acid dehydrogenase